MSDGFITSHIGVSNTSTIGDTEYTCYDCSDGATVKYGGLKVIFKERGEYYLIPMCAKVDFSEQYPYTTWTHVNIDSVDVTNGTIQIMNTLASGFYGGAMKCIVRTTVNGTAELEISYNLNQISSDIRRAFSIVVMYTGKMPKIQPIIHYRKIDDVWIREV